MNTAHLADNQACNYNIGPYNLYVNMFAFSP